MAKNVAKGKIPVESEDQLRLRFQVELEFVQCLGNPNYLHFIAQRGYFKDPSFVNYLKYLLYWKEPDYARFLKYPTCLYFLDLLQYEHFRREIVNAQCCKFIDDQSVLLWQHYTRRRVKLLSMHNNSSHLLNSIANGGGSISGGGGINSNPSSVANQNSSVNTNNGGALMQNGVGPK